MKHLPNLLTLANLFCGCIAIAYILTAQPYTSMSIGDRGGLPSWQWVYGAQQMYYGSLFIGLAGLCDVLDGFVARALKVFSPIGKDLDSLADIVSFGVAPSMILFKYLWDSVMGERNAMDVNMLYMVPAFLIACFGALRLAKYNITADTQKSYFIGMPIPAVGILVASFPLVTWFPSPITQYFNMLIHGRWSIYMIIAVLCFLMVSKIKFLKLLPSKLNLAQAWPQLIMLLFGVAGIFLIGLAATIPLIFVLYLLLSLVCRYPKTNE